MIRVLSNHIMKYLARCSKEDNVGKTDYQIFWVSYPVYLMFDIHSRDLEKAPDVPAFRLQHFYYCFHSTKKHTDMHEQSHCRKFNDMKRARRIWTFDIYFLPFFMFLLIKSFKWSREKFLREEKNRNFRVCALSLKLYCIQSQMLLCGENFRFGVHKRNRFHVCQDKFLS